MSSRYRPGLPDEDAGADGGNPHREAERPRSRLQIGVKDVPRTCWKWIGMKFATDIIVKAIVKA